MSPWHPPETLDLIFAVDGEALAAQKGADAAVAVARVRRSQLVHARHQGSLVGGLEAPVALGRAVLPDTSAGPTLRHVLQKRRHVSGRRRDGASGSPVSPLQVLEQRDVEGLHGDDLLQAAVLLLERLQPLRLVLLQGAVAGLSAVEGLVGDPRRLQVCGIVRPSPCSLAQLGHDPLHRVALGAHRSPPI
jgi:hypothetical protein